MESLQSYYFHLTKLSLTRLSVSDDAQDGQFLSTKTTLSLLDPNYIAASSGNSSNFQRGTRQSRVNLSPSPSLPPYILPPQSPSPLSSLCLSPSQIVVLLLLIILSVPESPRQGQVVAA